jgi:hypothetical protein
MVGHRRRRHCKKGKKGTPRRPPLHFHRSKAQTPPPSAGEPRNLREQSRLCRISSFRALKANLIHRTRTDAEENGRCGLDLRGRLSLKQARDKRVRPGKSSPLISNNSLASTGQCAGFQLVPCQQLPSFHIPPGFILTQIARPRLLVNCDARTFTSLWHPFILRFNRVLLRGERGECSQRSAHTPRLPAHLIAALVSSGCKTTPRASTLSRATSIRESVI